MKPTENETPTTPPSVRLDATVDGVTMTVHLTDESFRGTPAERLEHVADLARLASAAVEGALMPGIVVGEPPVATDKPRCMAHGKTREQHLDYDGEPQDCARESVRCRCATFVPYRLHWDTCPGRVR